MLLFFFFEWLLHPCFSAAATCMCQFHVHTSDVYHTSLHGILEFLSSSSFQHFNTKTIQALWNSIS